MNFKSFGKGSKISDWARVYKPEMIEIGDNVRIDDFCMLSGGSGIKLGNHIHIACGSYLFGGGGIVFEDFVQISTHISFFSQSDDFTGQSLVGPQIPMRYKPFLRSGQITLKRHVLLGKGCTVLPNVTIAEGCSVGAHSLIAENTQPWGIYAGTPAKRIGERVKDMLFLEIPFLKEWNKEVDNGSGSS